MKIILALVSTLSLSACVPVGYNHDKDRATYQPFTTAAQGVRSVPGIGFGYFRGQPSRAPSKEELEYVNANKVDFDEVSKENSRVNKKFTDKEIENLQRNTAKMSCIDMVDFGYRVLTEQARMTGDWESVYNYNSNALKKRCKR